MSLHPHIAAGLDLHKTFYQVSIISDINDIVYRERFSRDFLGLQALRDFLLSHHVEVAACESTSDYWMQPADYLSPHMVFIVGNPADMKANSHKKTDKTDADHIAHLALHNMVSPSRILSGDSRGFRSTIRLRYKLVQYRTQIKNQIHHIFDSELFRLSSVLSDVFGKSGMIIIDGILNGISIEEILVKLPTRSQKHADKLRKILQQNLSANACQRLAACVRTMKILNSEIKNLTFIAENYVNRELPREFEILTSIPGIGVVAAITLLAEIGDVHDFPTGDRFASWLGIVPRVYQSADKRHTGSITRRGSNVARWILTEAAQATGKTRDNALKRFLMSKKETIGKKKAIVATARKIATIIWHLLINDEMYEDEVYKKTKSGKKIHLTVPREVTIEEMLNILREANVIIKEMKEDKVDGGFS